ncbi:hypothetical protein GF337_11435 [candidate division KSB1 bacterium]|nr:hypothetical protein [candidate division KSB1 bacterium]
MINNIKILFISFLLTLLSICLSQTNPTHEYTTSFQFIDLIWEDDFENNHLNHWTIYDEIPDEPSNWHVRRGYLIDDSDSGTKSKIRGTHITTGDVRWRDYVITTIVSYTDDDYIGLLFRYQDKNNYYRLLMSSQMQIIRLDKVHEGEISILDSFDEEEWPECTFTITVAALKDTLTIYLNDIEFFHVQDSQFRHGKVGFFTCSNKGLFCDYLRIYKNYQLVSIHVPLKFQTGPYLQRVLNDEAVIMWRTNYPASSCVDYSLQKTAVNALESSNRTRIHEIELSDLEPGSSYYYRIRSDSITSDWYSFTTESPNDTAFSFILYGDNQTNFLTHRDIVSAFQQHTFDFIISVGDVVQRGHSSDWNTEFFNPLAPAIKYKPVYAAIGNHELNARYFYDYYSTPDSSHENYYSFSYENCFFIFIDNPINAYPDKKFYTDISPGSPQYSWLVSQLASESARTADWLIVCGHIPCYNVSHPAPYPNNMKYLVPLFEKYGVDIYFAGHNHNYQRGFANGVTYIVSGGGGGKLSERKIYTNDIITVMHRKHHYCKIDVLGKELSFTMYDIKNQALDKLQLTSRYSERNQY